MAEYLAFATQVSDTLQALVEETQVKIEPAVEFVSCGSGLDVHFVPKTALEKHLRKCHGERRPRPINNATFYYGRFNGETEGSDNHEQDKGEIQNENGDLHTLVENSEEGSEDNVDQEGVIAAVQKAANCVGDFYTFVQAWERIPRAFATMKDDERELVTSASLHRWLNAELNRPGVLSSDVPLDEELVEYVIGLLEHPDFCQPDLLVLELHEFLGNSVTKIVLALWKFMIIEIGLHSVFKTEKSEVTNNIQVLAAVEDSEPTPLKPASTRSQTQFSDAIAERDYKRRRASYRGKIGTKTGQAAYREMIQKHMVGLSLEMDRELVLGGGFRDEEDNANNAMQNRRKPTDWYNFTDALEVRNRSRSRPQNQTSNKKRRSKSRSRSRSRRSRSRSRSRRHRDRGGVDYRHRNRSRSCDRDSYRRDTGHRHRIRSRSRDRDSYRRDRR